MPTLDGDARRRGAGYMQALLHATLDFGPEMAAEIGGEAWDTTIVDLRDDSDARACAALAAFARDHEQLDDPANATDLAILVRSARKGEEVRAAAAALVLPFDLLGNIVFSGFSLLLSDRVPAARREHAREKLLRYAGLADGRRPITVEAEARIREGLARPGLLPPPRGKIEKDLAMTPVLLDDIAARFRQFGITGVDAALAALRAQFAAYHHFLQTELMPRARADFALPGELHAALMRSHGVDIPPAELAAIARAQYTLERAGLEALAHSGELGPPADMLTVLRRLKAQPIPADGLLAFFAARNLELEAMLRDHDLISLPSAPIRIDPMSEAESLSVPAPNMEPSALLDPNPPPPRVRIPTMSPERALDDFTYDGAAWPLMAHEGRPGHELQFHLAQERDLPVGRMIFADNANAEGWGLYSEAIVEPYVPLAGQFATRWMRLIRTARSFLDPELHLGKLSVDQARSVLVDEIGVSPAMAASELFRYTLLIPGQATSYFVGYRAFTTFRAEMERELGPRFSARRFHDAIMNEGCIPFDLLRARVNAAFATA